VMRITQRINRQRFEPTMQRQDNLCLFCNEQFTEQLKPEWDHLDNNANNSRPENLALVHRTCNNKKKFNPEYQVIAQDAKEEYEKAVSVCERTLADTGTTEELTSCQAISTINFRIAEQYLTEHTLLDDELLLKDTVRDVVGICRKNNGTGSEQAVYRYINTLTSSVYPFTLCLNAKGENFIRRRTEN